MPRKRDVDDAFALPPQKTRAVVPEAKAKAFVEAGTPQPTKRSSRLRRDAIDGARVNVYVPRDVEERLRERAFRERRSVSDAVTEALEQWLSNTTVQK